jgi:hypothetical protein
MTLRRFCYDFMVPALVVILLTLVSALVADLGKETQARTKVYPQIATILDNRLKSGFEMFAPAARNLNALSEETYYDQVAAVKATNADLKAFYDLIWDTRAHLYGGEDSQKQTVPGILPEARGLVVDIRAEVADFMKTTQAATAAIDGLSGETKLDLQALRTVLSTVDDSISTLDDQIANNGEAIEAAVDAVIRAVNSANALLSDPNVKATIAHVEGSAESLDDLMRPWRKAGNRVLAVLKFLLDKFKFTRPL